MSVVSDAIEMRENCPTINVKRYFDRDDIEQALPLIESLWDDTFITWLKTSLHYEPFWEHGRIFDSATDSMREEFWDFATDEAEHWFGRDARVYQTGRSGGWLIVDGLGKPFGWDSNMHIAWREFERSIKTTVHGSQPATWFIHAARAEWSRWCSEII